METRGIQITMNLISASRDPVIWMIIINEPHYIYRKNSLNLYQLNSSTTLTLNIAMYKFVSRENAIICTFRSSRKRLFWKTIDGVHFLNTHLVYPKKFCVSSTYHLIFNKCARLCLDVCEKILKFNIFSFLHQRFCPTSILPE